MDITSTFEVYVRPALFQYPIVVVFGTMLLHCSCKARRQVDHSSIQALNAHAVESLSGPSPSVGLFQFSDDPDRHITAGGTATALTSTVLLTAAHVIVELNPQVPLTLHIANQNDVIVQPGKFTLIKNPGFIDPQPNRDPRFKDFRFDVGIVKFADPGVLAGIPVAQVASEFPLDKTHVNLIGYGYQGMSSLAPIGHPRAFTVRIRDNTSGIDAPTDSGGVFARLESKDDFPEEEKDPNGFDYAYPNPCNGDSGGGLTVKAASGKIAVVATVIGFKPWTQTLSPCLNASTLVLKTASYFNWLKNVVPDLEEAPTGAFAGMATSALPRQIHPIKILTKIEQRAVETDTGKRANPPGKCGKPLHVSLKVAQQGTIRFLRSSHTGASIGAHQPHEDEVAEITQVLPAVSESDGTFSADLPTYCTQFDMSTLEQSRSDVVVEWFISLSTDGGNYFERSFLWRIPPFFN